MSSEPQATPSSTDHQTHKDALLDGIIALRLELNAAKQQIAAPQDEITNLHAKYARLRKNDHDTHQQKADLGKEHLDLYDANQALLHQMM